MRACNRFPVQGGFDFYSQRQEEGIAGCRDSEMPVVWGHGPAITPLLLPVIKTVVEA